MAPIRPEEITPAYKAAVIVAQLGTAAARPVFAQLPNEEIQAITGEVARLKEVDPSLTLRALEWQAVAAWTWLEIYLT